MTNSKTAITVFIPTFNRCELLAKAVDSVLSQDVDILLHILDNASTDDTSDLLDRLQKRYSSIIVTRQKTNVGAVSNFVDGFTNVETEFFLPLADDDELAPGFLKNALRIAQADDELGAVIHSTEVRQNARFVSASQSDLKGKQYPRDHLISFLKHGHYYSWSSILWRKRVLTDINIRSIFEQFGPPADVWFQFYIFLKHPVFISNTPGSIFNLHENQASSVLGLTPLTLNQVGRLLDAIKSSLIKSDYFSVDEIDSLMSTYTQEWIRLITTRQSDEQPSAGELHEMLTIYLKQFYPYTGFVNFPFIAFIDHARRLPSIKNNEPTTSPAILHRILTQVTPPLLITAIRRVRQHLQSLKTKNNSEKSH